VSSPTKITMTFFTELKKSNILMKSQKTQNSQRIKSHDEIITIHDFKKYYRATVAKT
jgi:hypothetical protein